MYNRYIPQPDGSYRRNQVPDNSRKPQPPPPVPPPSHEPPPKEEFSPHPPDHQDNSYMRPVSQQSGSISSFLRKLIPAGLDTGDLLIIVLLLLMAGDCQEDQNTAILTLVLYLFL